MHDPFFTGRVEKIGGFIEKKVVGIGENGVENGEFRFLSAREGVGVLRER